MKTGSNYKLIIGVPILALTVFCFSYLQLSHAPTASPTTVSHAIPARHRSSAPLAVQAHMPIQSSLTTQQPPATATQQLSTQTAAQAPNPANKVSPQPNANSNPALQAARSTNAPTKNPQKSLLHIALPN